ncbi:50S ribosomal protein L10 [Candidatus Wolfebacteria bacterium]|nr:50S ribosomal protein L10 [Candidatus Wolfebacteria bacterium]
MLTKEQKIEQIKQGQKLLKENKSVVFVDFSEAGVEDLRSLRKTLKEIGAKMKVLKKKLMRIAFQRENLDFNPEQFELQAAAIFSDKDISEIISPAYKFSQQLKKAFKVLGAYDIENKNFIDEEMAIKIGQLPSKEILLGQLVGVLSAPIRTFMYVLNEKSKQMVEKDIQSTPSQ